jgi:hypothetical protein
MFANYAPPFVPGQLCGAAVFNANRSTFFHENKASASGTDQHKALVNLYLFVKNMFSSGANVTGFR